MNDKDDKVKKDKKVKEIIEPTTQGGPGGEIPPTDDEE